MELGENIRRIRETKGWTQEQLAEKAELDISYLGQIERGLRTSPGLKIVKKLAYALEVELGYLLDSQCKDKQLDEAGNIDNIPEWMAEELKRCPLTEQTIYAQIFQLIQKLMEYRRK
ncbi:helix-turn-helix domain-containing protein [Paenibacillus wenxiniae]|uniref:Helix-turn-helix domain-containing protein n=1 Tax=Paenibacillus wenxiniae TaxID=1636843 RepID=A0ABW4RHM5_9BACL